MTCVVTMETPLAVGGSQYYIRMTQGLTFVSIKEIRAWLLKSIVAWTYH